MGLTRRTTCHLDGSTYVCNGIFHARFGENINKRKICFLERVRVSRSSEKTITLDWCKKCGIIVVQGGAGGLTWAGGLTLILI